MRSKIQPESTKKNFHSLHSASKRLGSSNSIEFTISPRSIQGAPKSQAVEKSMPCLGQHQTMIDTN
jgi:hypothetical protein